MPFIPTAEWSYNGGTETDGYFTCADCGEQAEYSKDYNEYLCETCEHERDMFQERISIMVEEQEETKLDNNGEPDTLEQDIAKAEQYNDMRKEGL